PLPEGLRQQSCGSRQGTELRGVVADSGRMYRCLGTITADRMRHQVRRRPESAWSSTCADGTRLSLSSPTRPIFTPSVGAVAPGSSPYKLSKSVDGARTIIGATDEPSRHAPRVMIRPVCDHSRTGARGTENRARRKGVADIRGDAGKHRVVRRDYEGERRADLLRGEPSLHTRPVGTTCAEGNEGLVSQVGWTRRPSCGRVRDEHKLFDEGGIGDETGLSDIAAHEGGADLSGTSLCDE